MILGSCPVCYSWTLSPLTVRCIYCEGKVVPLQPLVMYEVPDGTRINAQGQLFSPMGERLDLRKDYPDSEDISFLRRLLLGYDEGRETEGSVSVTLFLRSIRRVVEHAKHSSERLMTFSSYCGSGPPPVERARVEIEVQGDNVTVTPLRDDQ